MKRRSKRLKTRIIKFVTVDNQLTYIAKVSIPTCFVDRSAPHPKFGFDIHKCKEVTLLKNIMK